MEQRQKQSKPDRTGRLSFIVPIAILVFFVLGPNPVSAISGLLGFTGAGRTVSQVEVACPGPSLISPPDNHTILSRSVIFNWQALSGCTFDGYTFRVKDTADMDSGGTTIVDASEAGTSRIESFDPQWDNQELFWGVRAANAPDGASWSVRSFVISPGGGSCPVPALLNPPENETLASRTVSFSWMAIRGCTFDGYTFRVKDTANMDAGGTTIVDASEAGTSRIESFDSQWDSQQLFWGVRAAGAPSGASWSVRSFVISPGSGSCPAPELVNPPNNEILAVQTVSFSWSALSGCTFDGYTFRVKDTADMNAGGTTIVDASEAGTSRIETFDSRWNSQNLFWGVRADNAPDGADWSVRSFRFVLPLFLPLVNAPPPNSPPYTPFDPLPANGATDASRDVNLSWKGGDPDGDAVRYDVTFEANDGSQDKVLCANIAETRCDPGRLAYDTRYYWQVVARDIYGATTAGPVWSFKTEQEPATPPPPSCSNLIANGGFEAYGGWIIGVNEYPAVYSTARAHSGGRSMRIGITNPYDNRYAYSSIWQYVTIPAGASKVQLDFWLFPISSGTYVSPALAPPAYIPTSAIEDPMANDAQYVLLYDQAGQQHTLLFQHSNNQAWQQHALDLRAFAGQSVSIYFGVYNNGYDGATGMYVDDVSLELCS